ncbi:MAG: hypothetical protein WA172_00510 [Terriglobales bacterium]
MDGLDNKFEALVKDSSFAVAILHNSTTADFELVNLERVAEETAQCFTARGLGFAGVIGLVGGTPRYALDAPIGGETAHRIIACFTERVEDEINARVPQAESVSWLRRLWTLPDTRVN